MTWLRSIPYRVPYFPLQFLFMSIFPFFASPTWIFVDIQYRNVFQLKMSCWPVLSSLLFAVPVSRQIEWAGLSLWLWAVLPDRWASQLIRSLVFVELWNVCCWWIRPSPAFLWARSRFCSAGGQVVDPRLFKVIRVTVRKINWPLLPSSPS